MEIATAHLMRRTIAKARYRVEQFCQALTACYSISEERIEQAARVLTPQARSLFLRQDVQDQRHALAVYEELCRGGYTNHHLLAAALLHDVGKAAARFPAWQRGIYVLTARFAPQLLDHLVDASRPFDVYNRHPAIGARWAEEAGCSALTVALIRRHEERLTDCETEEERLLAALQAADRTN